MDLHDYRDRLLNAIDRLSELSDTWADRGDEIASVRVDGKAEGVRLALSYLDEAQR